MAILAGIGVVVLSQTKLKEHIQGIISQRDKNATDRDNERKRANLAEKTLANTSNTLVGITGDLVTTSNELVSTKSNLEKASSDRDKAVQAAEKAKDDAKAARNDLMVWSSIGMKPDDVKAKLTELVKTKEAVVVMDEEIKMQGRRIAKLTNELAKYIDPENYVVPLPPGLKGKVLVVDPKWEFVVLDIGENQNVLKDGIMMVHRDGKLVGKVRIANVMPNRSVANVVSGWRLEEIHEGDQVLF